MLTRTLLLVGARGAAADDQYGSTVASALDKETGEKIAKSTCRSALVADDLPAPGPAVHRDGYRRGPDAEIVALALSN